MSTIADDDKLRWYPLSSYSSEWICSSSSSSAAKYPPSITKLVSPSGSVRTLSTSAETILESQSSVPGLEYTLSDHYLWRRRQQQQQQLCYCHHSLERNCDDDDSSISSTESEQAAYVDELLLGQHDSMDHEPACSISYSDKMDNNDDEDELLSSLFEIICVTNNASAPATTCCTSPKAKSNKTESTTSKPQETSVSGATLARKEEEDTSCQESGLEMENSTSPLRTSSLFSQVELVMHPEEQEQQQQLKKQVTASNSSSLPSPIPVVHPKALDSLFCFATDMQVYDLDDDDQCSPLLQQDIYCTSATTRNILEETIHEQHPFPLVCLIDEDEDMD